ncbi:MAG: copper resistance protein CopC/CopD [Candidatus Dormibacteraeota bacterium]|nr:copper resistance protein CopC/CopD [Candidatus Dormibacteraeota bacterium]
MAVALAAAVAGAVSASAHALPQSTTPAEGSTVQQAPPSVSIVFGQTPDVGLSSLTVVNGSGTNVDAGPTKAAPGSPLELQVPLKSHLTKGVYTVTWKTVSTVDGHLATGSFAFGVGVSASSVPHTAAVVGASPPSPLAVVARLVLFVGLIVVVGAVILGAYAFGLPPPLLRKVIVAAAIFVVLGTVGVAAAQGLSAGIGPAALFGSSLGRTLLTRAVPAIVLLIASLLLLRAQGRGAALLTVVAGGAALAGMAIDVLNSHAAAEGPAALNTFAQVLHVVAVGVWIGGLVALLVVLRRSSDERQSHATRRLSTLAGYGIVVVASTGVFRAFIEIQTWQNLVTTAFGVLVLLKLGLLIVLAGLGALNRYGNIPRLPRTLRRLRRVVTTEALVALGALTVAAALVNVAPPVDYGAAAAPANIVVSGSDYAQTDKVSLTVTPGVSGFNTFDVRVTDYNSGSSVNASRVVLQFTQPFRPELGTSTLTLSHQSDGAYSAHGTNLSLAGIWEIAAIIENGLNSTEIHLQLTTITPPPVVQVQRFAGPLPTLYTITVTPQIQAQVYLDPNKPGADQWHCTWLDPNGNEIPMADMTFGMTTPGGTPTILVKRRLDEIGHFVSDATVPKGTTRFDLIGTTVSGQTVSTYINITPGS